LTAASHVPRSDLGTDLIGDALRIDLINDVDFGPGSSTGQSRAPNLARTAARELTRNGWAMVSRSDDESLGILVFSGIRLAGRIGVQEEPSTPHARLACIHLQTSSHDVSVARVAVVH
jgi:hypothetical protein